MYAEGLVVGCVGALGIGCVWGLGVGYVFVLHKNQHHYLISVKNES